MLDELVTAILDLKEEELKKLDELIANSDSKLHQALSMQRISPCTFFRMQEKLIGSAL